MATKIEAKKNDESADDLSILHPDRTLEIANKILTVREYSFVQGLRLRPMIAPLLDSLVGTLSKDAGLEDILDVLAKNHETVLFLMAESIDEPVEWFETLSEEDGNLLLITWWTVNAPFLMRSVINRRMAKLASKKARLAGETSTQSSSLAGTTPNE